MMPLLSNIPIFHLARNDMARLVLLWRVLSNSSLAFS